MLTVKNEQSSFSGASTAETTFLLDMFRARNLPQTLFLSDLFPKHIVLLLEQETGSCIQCVHYFNVEQYTDLRRVRVFRKKHVKTPH